MNAAYIAIGCAFVAIGGGSLAMAKKAKDATAGKTARTSGTLMMLAGAIFFVTGVAAGI